MSPVTPSITCMVGFSPTSVGNGIPFQGPVASLSPGSVTILSNPLLDHHNNNYQGQETYFRAKW